LDPDEQDGLNLDLPDERMTMIGNGRSRVPGKILSVILSFFSSHQVNQGADHPGHLSIK
jgi:hypothetical protein